MTPYQPRHYNFHGIWTLENWRVKLYTIRHASRHNPTPQDLETAKQLAARTLSALDPSQHHNAAFLILHAGADGEYLLIDWWTSENMLSQTLHIRLAGEPTFKDVTSTSLVACIWELQIIGAERQAWIECVLKHNNLPAYSEQFMEGEF